MYSAVVMMLVGADASRAEGSRRHSHRDDYHSRAKAQAVTSRHMYRCSHRISSYQKPRRSRAQSTTTLFRISQPPESVGCCNWSIAHSQSDYQELFPIHVNSTRSRVPVSSAPPVAPDSACGFRQQNFRDPFEVYNFPIRQLCVF